MLRELLREPTLEAGRDFGGGEDMERLDSGYFSRRSSKLSSRVNSISIPERPRDIPLDTSTRFDSLASSNLGSMSEPEFTLVAEGTPSTTEGESRTIHPNTAMTSLDGAHDPQSRKTSDVIDFADRKCSQSNVQCSNWRHNSEAGLDGTEEASRFFNWPVARRLRDNDAAHFFDRPTNRRHSEIEADELEDRIAPEETPRNSLEAFGGRRGEGEGEGD